MQLDLPVDESVCFSEIIPRLSEPSGSLPFDLLMFFHIARTVIRILTGKFIGIELLRERIEYLDHL